MQTNEMFAFWKGGATEQVRDGFLNKKAVANQCSPRRRVFSVHYGSTAKLEKQNRNPASAIAILGGAATK